MYTIIYSNHIFTGLDDNLLRGYILLKNNKIETITDNFPITSKNYLFFDCSNQLVLPGFVDTHCFFTGHLLHRLLINGKDINSEDKLIDFTKSLDSEVLLIKLNDLNLNIDINNIINKPLIIFDQYLESCIMNDLAFSTFKFNNSNCYSEGYWRLLKYLLSLPQAKTEFIDYQKFLNSKGITSVKEIGFDNFYGFTDILSQLESDELLTLRVNFMSQPVGHKFDITYGIEMKKNYKSNFLSFSGYNQMTDGSISQHEGLLKETYEDKNSNGEKFIEWDNIEKDVLLADSHGIRFSLHAQGDLAVEKCIDIFEKCKVDKKGKLINRHIITDLELTDSNNSSRMGELGVIAEIYPQIMSLYERDEKIRLTKSRVGVERMNRYWNRQGLLNKKVTISCATDLPLLYDDIPESVYHSVYGLFKDNPTPFNIENTLSITDLLKAWTINGQYNLGKESLLGTIEPGKLGDITIFNKNLFDMKASELNKLYITHTFVDGKLVYIND